MAEAGEKPDAPGEQDGASSGAVEPAGDVAGRGRIAAAIAVVRREPRKRLALVAAALAGAVVAAVLIAGGDGGPPPSALADAVPYDGRSPREPSGEGTRVIVALPRPSLGAARIADPEDQRDYVRSLEEESGALRSALGARGIRLSDVVTFTRTFNGFAATVRTGDLADLPSLGVRAQPVRRFYPATSEPARVPGLRMPVAAAPLGGASVAVLDSGADRAHPLLAGRLDPGYDAVDGDDDPAPAKDPRGRRRETSGTALAGILVAAGERVLPIRVAGLQPATQGSGLEDVAISDQLIAGLERAVDPDGDGATDDHVPVAVVGVNSPYAAFERSPEARAVGAAAELGTLVIAPAGSEGAAAGPNGTVGSPASAPDALAVGALAAPEGVGHVDLEVGGADAGKAALLSGFPPPAGLRTAGPIEATDPSELLARGARSLRGRLAVVRAGDEPAARAAAAAAAGARVVLLAEPRRRPLPAIPAGRIAAPVLGVTGDAAEGVLEEEAGAEVAVGDVEPGRPPIATLPPQGAPGGGEAGAAAEALSGAALSPFSSRGPAAGGGVAPGLAAPGAALTAVPGNASAIVGGSAVAAARTAIEAARLVRERPDTTPRELRAALVGAADPDPRLPARGAGAGALRRQPQAAGITARTTPERRADPCPGTLACVRIVLGNESASPASPALALVLDRGTRATLARPRVRIPAGGRREAEVDVAAAGPDGLASGRLVVRGEGASAAVSHPFAIATAPPEPPPLGPLTVQRDGGRVTGVRFALGAFERGDPLGRGTSVALTERLTLSLVRARGGRAVRRLTPPGGARELLPAEYAYELPAGTLRALRRGRYAFRAVARSPRGGKPATARSEPFRR
ncbi:MAG TPA: S8 family serine peptidase [Solirubrobacteraceae bacterium]|nr:S8 family serine peptidase [Solirubrobacteraceae bacterium]